jgi:hypothetical protein
VYETPDAPHGATGSSYPWTALIAVAAAAGIAGTLAGYLYGYNRATRTTMLTDADFAAGMTEAEVAVSDPETPSAEGIVSEPLVAGADPAPSAPVTTRSPAGAVPTGRFVIRSQPDGALVTVDGRLEGPTPVTVVDLPFGEYAVQVARPGYTPYQETHTLSADEPDRTLLVRLEAAFEPPPLTTGSIVFDSRPQGANVLLDGRLVGTTPLRLPEVIAGTHDVRMELTGYRPVSAGVTVEPGRQARFAVTLTSGRSGGGN